MSPVARAVLPPPEELARALERDLAWIASALGAEVVSAVPVSPLRGRERPRTAFHVTLRDGRAVKLRRMKTAERAAELARLLERAAPLGLPQPLLQREESLVVAWLADAAPFTAWPGDLVAFAAAGRLLGRIHAVPDVDGRRLPFEGGPDAELETMDGQLAALVESKHLPVELAARLRKTVRREACAPVLHGLTQGDFAAENLLVDAEGSLRVVDNEALQIGILDLDLARTWARWPMPDLTWRAFLDGYRQGCGRRVEDRALRPWRIRTLVLSAWYRVAYGLAGAEEPLARLRALARSSNEGAPAAPSR